MRNKKSLLQLWWHYRTDREKELLTEIGTCLLMILAIVALMTITLLLPYLLSEYLPKK